MARGIPPVRRWRVRLWKDNAVTQECVVDAINKRFAYWNARDQHLGWTAMWQADRVSVSLVRP